MLDDDFEKPIKRYGRAFITPVDLSNMVRMSKLGLGPHVGQNIGINCSFADNHGEKKLHWFFRDVGHVTKTI